MPSFDGTTWRLHTGEKAKIVFEITKEKLLKVVHDLESYVYPDVKGALANEILDIFMNDIAIVINHYSEEIKKL